MSIIFVAIAVALLVAFIRCLNRNAKWESECQRLQANCLKKVNTATPNTRER